MEGILAPSAAGEAALAAAPGRALIEDQVFESSRCEGAGASPAVRMNYDIRLRSRRSLLFGVVVLLAGGVGASLSSPWWLLMLPIGLASIFRVERNVAGAALAALEHQGIPIVNRESHFYGIAHGRFYRGAVSTVDVACFARGISSPVVEGSGTAPTRWRRNVPEWTKWMSIALDEIDRIEWNSAGKSIRFVLPDRSEQIDCTMTFERNEVLKILRPARPWIVTTTSRTAFRFDLRSWILCLPLMLFAATIALTAVGIVQPHQLPLADWNNIAGIRGKGRAMAVLWVLASQAYRFVVEQCPPVVAGIVGVGGVFVFGALLAILQWPVLTDETWTHPRPPVGGD